MSLPAPITTIQTALLNGAISTVDLPLPFAREILLSECHVAGTSYQDIDGVASELKTDDRLVLRREPENRHDPLAIAALTRDGVKLGYVPQAKNEVLARLLDAGKMIHAKVRNVSDLNGWVRIEIGIYLNDL